ncbi:MAG: autotransporter outer membrane beta-barrel domain-containing protein, partial [Desulfovibrionaceae bacterium]|nr:autotransporter outer membrane beta-barrel domain-containing protein [Desulfovibrionaceae bacterium]
MGTSSLDVSGGTFYDDLVGGNFVNTTYDGDNTVGTSSVSVSGSAVVNATVVGGSEVNAGKSNVTSSSVSISGGTINGTAVGASAVESQGSTAASSKVTSSSVSISGGSVSRVIGGGLASTGSEATDGASASVSVGTSEVVISGGTVGSEDGVLSVAGGSLASGEGNKAETTGSASTIISGGTVIGPVAAGSAAAEGATASAGAVSLTVSGGTIEGSVYTGGASIDGSSVTTESSVLAVTGGTITEDLVVGDYVVSSAGVEGEEQAMLNAEGDSSSVSVSIANTTIGGTVSVVTDGAEVTFNGGTTTIGNLALNADSTTSVTNGATVSANDVNVEAGTLSIANGTLSVLDEIHAQSSTNEETGAIESSGTIQIGSGGTLSSAGKVVVDGNGALTVSEGGTLTLTETGTMEITGGKVTFADGSTLTVDATAAAAAATAIISVNGGELEVDAGSTLVLADAVSGQTYNIVDGSEEYWTNIVASSDMISMVMDKTTGTVSAAVADATSAYSGISGETGGLLQTLYSTGLNSTTADAAGVRFLSRATDSRYLGSDKGAAVKAIESTARFATLGAVPQMTKMASDAGTNAAVARFGFATSEDSVMAINAAGDEVKANDAGFALWIAPMWQNRSGFGMEAGELDYGFNGNIGGVAIGADYTFSNNIRAGLLFNMGGGYAESSGDLSGVENSMTFWGLGAYAGWTGCGFGIMADVMYTSTWNSVEGSLDSRLGMGSQLEADIQASAITAGLRAEYTFETSVLDFIPHVGV